MLLAMLVACGATATAQAAENEFGIGSFTTTFSSDAAGTPSDYAVEFGLTPLDDSDPLGKPAGMIRNQYVDLPKGFVADPTVVPPCNVMQMSTAAERCPASSIVGYARLRLFNVLAGTVIGPYNSRVYRLVPYENEVAAFGFVAFVNYPVRLGVTVGPENDYRVRVASENQQAGMPLISGTVTMWGVPADFQGPGTLTDLGYASPTYGGPLVGAQRQRFASVPTNCDQSLVTSMTVSAWNSTQLLDPVHASSPAPTACDNVSFVPNLAVTPEVSHAATPSGYRVVLGLGQAADIAVPRTANLKDAVVRLPAGVVISPSAAHGLQACTDAQLDIGSSDPEGCPAASKIGDVVIESPVLDEQVRGAVYTGSQLSGDPASGDMFRIFVTAAANGVKIKLRGQVAVDPNTGQITARFLDNPDLPFERMTLTFKGGDRAPLANPMTCGGFNTASTFTSWAGQSVDTNSPMSIDQGCDQSAFAPSLSAGTTDPVASAHSTFVLSSTKASGGADLDGVSVKMPEGLLGTLKGNLGQQIGTVRVAAGLGAYPFELPGSVVLEGAYGDAPYSLRVTVPAKAGPFDLGDVVVRQKVYIHPETAEIRIVSDPFPTVVKGVPVRLQRMAVVIDKPGFMFNPTSCDPMSIDATFSSPTAADVQRSARFKVADCGSLDYRPRLAMRLVGRKQIRTGTHPGLRSVLTQPADEGSANIAKARVVLPKAVVLDPNNSVDPKLVCDYDAAQKADCPKSTVIGRAVASTPVLERPLRGDVHLVQGIRFGPDGNRIRTTPALLVKLRGEVDINVRAKTTVQNGRLVTTFPNVPDAPVNRFALNIRGGKQGILVITRTRKAKINICRNRQVANVQTDGHHGRTRDYRIRVKTPCGKARKAKAGQRNAATNNKRAAAKRNRAVARRPG